MTVNEVSASSNAGYMRELLQYYYYVSRYEYYQRYMTSIIYDNENVPLKNKNNVNPMDEAERILVVSSCL